MAMGELEAHVLGTVQKLGKASARDVMREIGGRQLAYTTISTVLDRLHQKGMVRRVRVIGRGGTKYLYSPTSSSDLRASIVNRALDRLVSAFGPSIMPTIYDRLEEISNEESADLRKKIARAKGERD